MKTTGPTWRVFGPLVDAPPLGRGPEQRLPYAHDHRVGPRLPHGLTVGQGPNVHTARHRTPAVVGPLATDMAVFAVHPSDQLLRPAGSSEALGWRETADFADVTIADGSTSIEVARLDVVRGSMTVVERLATYLRATPLGRDGAAAGPTFVTGCCVDPLGPIHPVSGEPLRVRWALLGTVSDRGPYDGPAHFVVGTAIQLPTYWDDLRYAWGSRYSLDLQLVVSQRIESIRLVAIPDAGASSWSITVGGRLATWAIPGGPRSAAIEAATRRS